MCCGFLLLAQGRLLRQYHLSKHQTSSLRGVLDRWQAFASKRQTERIKAAQLRAKQLGTICSTVLQQWATVAAKRQKYRMALQRVNHILARHQLDSGFYGWLAWFYEQQVINTKYVTRCEAFFLVD